MKQTKGKKWLTGLAITGALAGFLAAPVSADIKDVYKTNCKKCHGWDGKGDTPQGRKEKAQNWTDADFQKKVKDSEIVDAILNGKKEADGRQMKGLKDKVSEADAKELVKIVRAFAKSPGPFPDEK